MYDFAQVPDLLAGQMYHVAKHQISYNKLIMKGYIIITWKVITYYLKL